MNENIIQALDIKRKLGIKSAAGYLRNRGFTVEQAVAILARPVYIVVPSLY